MNNLTDKQKGKMLALIGILFITPDSLFIRMVGLNSWDLVFYRGFLPFIFLLIGLLWYYKKNFLKSLFAIGIAGIVNALIVAFTNITFIVSLENTNVANTLIMLSLSPFMAAILSGIFLKELPEKRTWIAIILCIFFTIYIFYDSYTAGRFIGDLFGFITALLVAASQVVLRYGKLVNFLPSLLIAKLFTAIFVIYFVKDFTLIGNDIFLIPIMCLFCVTIPLALITLAPRYIPAHEVALFFLLETTLGPLWVWIFINEAPSIKALIGGGLIIITIIVHSYFDLLKNKNQSS
ncbi:MAG: EamA family transporter [Pelagibacteraceae bacterium]|nr:EamA family transporter [Pelagibacteraceae bacterium]PPR51675.1 MAG: hypothetical protein CFH20_00461 [Alphaproteobacteria bacterium MarineAlpha5_Bin10]|tara:strand:- start:1231 stop:2106 length:876 start_codon:yes stop_codon:yes gene_type:complete